MGKKGGEWGKKGEKRKTMGENIGKILKNCRMTWEKKRVNRGVQPAECNVPKISVFVPN